MSVRGGSSTRNRPGVACTLFIVALIVLAASPTSATESEGRLSEDLRDTARRAPHEVVDVLVMVRGSASMGDARVVASYGLVADRVFPSFGIVHATGRASDVAALASDPRVALIESNALSPFDLASATVASNARAAWDAKSTSVTPVVADGRVVKGTGVGVAVIDSGVDFSHPDLAGALGVSLKYLPRSEAIAPTEACDATPWAATENSDWSGHGTHVAGIIAGRGIMSGGRFTGVAPGATLYGLGSGEAGSILWNVEALAWVACNHATVSPAIKVVSNSWGRDGAFDPDAAVNRAVSALVADGITVVFSAGNRGAGGTVNAYGKNPAPGVIVVASYDDAGTGTRQGTIPSTSSGCGALDDARECPDVAAPGAAITSTRNDMDASPIAPGQERATWYKTIGGTSMAAPHVSGIVALLLQANPALTPAHVEDILEDAATVVDAAGVIDTPDPSNPSSDVNVRTGHGLVDALAALRDPRVGATGGNLLLRVHTEPHLYTQAGDAAAVDATAEVGWSARVGEQVTLAERGLVSDDETFHLTDGMSCAFRVLGHGFDSTVPCFIRTERSVLGEPLAAYRADVGFTFPTPGTFSVELHLTDGHTQRAIDQLQVRVTAGVTLQGNAPNAPVALL